MSLEVRSLGPSKKRVEAWSTSELLEPPFLVNLLLGLVRAEGTTSDRLADRLANPLRPWSFARTTRSTEICHSPPSDLEETLHEPEVGSSAACGSKK